MTTKQATIVNGIDTDAVHGLVRQITDDPAKARTRWHSTTHWIGGTQVESRITRFEIGDEVVEKDFTIRVDEPLELGGTNRYPNPQEVLLSALNSCMTIHYAVACAVHGIELESLRIETEGDIDIRGFLEVDPDAKPGYESIRYKVFIKGNGTPEQFQQVHETVTKFSPNRYNLAEAIKLNSQLVIE